jgi:hypothetical protein
MPRAGVIALFAALLAAPSLARADEAPLAPGMELEAIQSVTLHQAEIAKGSKVAVTDVVKHEGKIDGVKIDLGDGHIVKVALATVRNFFKIAE